MVDFGRLATIINHPQGKVTITETGEGKRRIEVILKAKAFSPNTCITTIYPVELIELILKTYGPSYLCDEIQRDEDHFYVQDRLLKSILAHVSEDKLKNKRLLDFGCGSGSSTMILARNFPKTEIVGVELIKDFVEIAQKRNLFYGFGKRVKFYQVPDSSKIPKDLGKFDFIVFNAVYEHLLPSERELLLTQLWGCLNIGGIIFINETPFRYYPIEIHTTGLPLINYLPDRMAYAVARRYSKMVSIDESWDNLLRRGIRGATENEILRILRKNGQPLLLQPIRLGCKDRIDLWYVPSQFGSRLTGTIVNFRQAYSIFSSKTFRYSLKLILKITGIAFLNSITLAIMKKS